MWTPLDQVEGVRAKPPCTVVESVLRVLHRLALRPRGQRQTEPVENGGRYIEKLFSLKLPAQLAVRFAQQEDSVFSVVCIIGTGIVFKGVHAAQAEGADRTPA